MSNNEIREKRKKVICDLVKDDFYVPMKEKELAMFLQVAKEDREEFREILRELLAERKLTLTVKGKYMKSNGKVLTGTFISNAKGFGFVEVEGRDEDLFIPEDKQGDEIFEAVVKGKKQRAQKLVEQAVKDGKDPQQLIDESLIPGIIHVGELYERYYFSKT